MEIKSGFAFHCHHDTLVEWVSDYARRVDYIKRRKPVEEQELRLRLFKLIPEEKLPGKTSPEGQAYETAWKAYKTAREAYVKAREAYETAREAYVKAREAYETAWKAYETAREAYKKAWKASTTAWKAYETPRKAFETARKAFETAWEAFETARKAYTTAFRTELETLHKELCPNCPWDGQTIFSPEPK